MSRFFLRFTGIFSCILLFCGGQRFGDSVPVMDFYKKNFAAQNNARMFMRA